MIVWIRRHRRFTIAVVCAAATVVGAAWLSQADLLGNIGFLLALEAIPLAALVAAGDELPWWLGMGASAGIAAVTAASVQSVKNSSSSTAVVVLPLVPLILLAVVPALVAVCDVVALVRLRLRGGRIGPPWRREIVLGVTLGAVGFLALFVFGLLAGLLTAFAVWAHRVRADTI
jgi:hypothetical protein